MQQLDHVKSSCSKEGLVGPFDSSDQAVTLTNRDMFWVPVMQPLADAFTIYLLFTLGHSWQYQMNFCTATNAR